MLDYTIKNPINRWTHHLTALGHSKPFISRFVARMVRNRGPIGNCTCDNWGPRWIEDSLNLCCPGCYTLALDSDQMMFVNGVKPVTTDMVEKSMSWGFDKAKIRELNS
jgi:hypothetical protein